MNSSLILSLRTGGPEIRGRHKMWSHGRNSKRKYARNCSSYQSKNFSPITFWCAAMKLIANITKTFRKKYWWFRCRAWRTKKTLTELCDQKMKSSKWDNSKIQDALITWGFRIMTNCFILYRKSKCYRQGYRARIDGKGFWSQICSVWRANAFMNVKRINRPICYSYTL